MALQQNFLLALSFYRSQQVVASYMIASIFSKTSRNLYVSVSGHLEAAPRVSLLLRTFPKRLCEFSPCPPAEYSPWIWGCVPRELTIKRHLPDKSLGNGGISHIARSLLALINKI